jgi:hypothetical protein
VRRKQKGRPEATFEDCFSNVDQAAAGLIARRCESPSQPRPAKPANIIAQVDGSATGEGDGSEEWLAVRVIRVRRPAQRDRGQRVARE